MTEEATQHQLTAISTGLQARITNGTIPKLDIFSSDFTKGTSAAKFETNTGLKIKAFANERRGAGMVDSVVIIIDDYGKDKELTELILKLHGRVPVKAIEVILHDELDPSDVGRARLIDPGPYLSTHEGYSTDMNPKICTTT